MRFKLLLNNSRNTLTHFRTLKRTALIWAPSSYQVSWKIVKEFKGQVCVYERAIRMVVTQLSLIA